MLCNNTVGIKGHAEADAEADAVAEAPTGVARALLYIVRGSPSFLLHPSFKTFILPYLSSNTRLGKTFS